MIRKKLKQAALDGKQNTVKTIAQTLVQSQNTETMLNNTILKLERIHHKITETGFSTLVLNSMRDIALIQLDVADEFDLITTQEMIESFEKESMKLETKQELVNDTLNDALDVEGDNDDRVLDIINEINDEVAIEFGDNLDTQLDKPAQKSRQINKEKKI